MATKHKIEVFTDGDECEEIHLDGKRIASTNHDEHGWDGMGVARNMAKGIAAQMGWSYQEGLDLPDDEG